MKSEQEIRKKLEISYCDFSDENGVVFSVGIKPDFNKLSKQQCFDFGMIEGCFRTCNWTLEGKPRYSVEELEKIFNSKIVSELMDNSTAAEIVGLAFFKFLKDKEKVEAILNG